MGPEGLPGFRTMLLLLPQFKGMCMVAAVQCCKKIVRLDLEKGMKSENCGIFYYGNGVESVCVLVFCC